MKKYISEFTGTGLYVFLGCGSALVANLMLNALGITIPLAYTNLLIAMVFGLTFMTMWFFLNHISGCHLNPAVSLAKLMTKKISVKDFAGYVIAQFAGGFAGAGLLILIIGGRFSFYANEYGQGSVLGTKPGTAFLIELILTFILVSVFLKITDKEETPWYAGIAIGITLIAVHIFGAPFTGTSVNPARSLGTGILQGGNAMSQVWLFIAAPLAGAVLAALFYMAMNRPEKKAETEVDGTETTEETETEADGTETTEETETEADGTETAEEEQVTESAETAEEEQVTESAETAEEVKEECQEEDGEKKETEA